MKASSNRVNKGKLHHFWRKIHGISQWYFLVLAVVFAATFVYAYRDNNLRMLELRDAVFEADEADEDVEAALRDLRDHVHSHMNTSLVTDTSIYPPIQLTKRYERLEARENNTVRQHNDRVATQAESQCAARHGGGQLQQRARCVQDYISANSLEIKEIPKEFYQFDFVSPRWSPDLAGWSLVLAVFFGFLFAVRFTLERWLRHELRNHA